MCGPGGSGAGVVELVGKQQVAGRYESEGRDSERGARGSQQSARLRRLRLEWLGWWVQGVSGRLWAGVCVRRGSAKARQGEDLAGFVGLPFANLTVVGL